MRLLATIALGALAAFAATLAALMLVMPWMLHLERYVITSGSMAGAIDQGTLIYSRVVPVGDVKQGDIITFAPPGYHLMVTHRVVAVKTDKNGNRMYRTKGDANPSVDPWGWVYLDHANQAVYWFQIPYMGFLLAALSLRWVKICFIAAPAMLVALATLRSIWRERSEDGQPLAATIEVPVGEVES